MSALSKHFYSLQNFLKLFPFIYELYLNRISEFHLLNSVTQIYKWKICQFC